MKKIIYITAFLVINNLLALQLIAAEQLLERVYLQTDKQTYLAGEMLWMKFYLTDQDGKTSSISKIGYVEILDGSSAQVQAKVELKDGIGEGWLEIPSGLPTGYYRLIAYTRYMQNEGEEVFFRKNIGVINTFRTDENTEVTEAAPLPNRAVGLENTISVTTDKVTYPNRTSGEVRIDRLPENIRSLTVSITGIDLEEKSTVNIISWKNRLPDISSGNFSNNLIPEYEGHIIKAKIVNVDSEQKPVERSVVPLLAFVGDEIRLFGGQIKNNSDVEFYTKRTGGMPELVTTSLAPSSSRYRVDVLSPYVHHSEVQLPTLQLNPAWEESLLQRSVGLQVLHTYMADSLNQLEYTSSYLNFKPDWSYILDEYTRFTTMEEVVIEFVLGLRFRRINGKRTLAVLTEERAGFTIGNSLVLLDGIPIIDHEVIFNYDPLLVKQIDVYKGKFVFGGQMFDGLASFRTYHNDYPGLNLDNTNQFFDYEGTQARRKFYAPSYKSEKERLSRIPDYRHTLLWEPNLKIKGETAISVPFSTSDLSGEYLVTVEGLTTEGNPVYGTYSFKVD